LIRPIEPTPAGRIHTLTRRRFALLPLGLVGVAAALRAGAEAATLPASVSLAAELAVALGRGEPLIVMASLHGCPFCNVVRDSYLAPLRRDKGQPMVQLDLRSAQPALDFQAARRSHDALLRAWEVKVAPTLLFFGSGGREVAPRLAGASIPDFYGAYLDERLRMARLHTG
jgi:hypothetical protein